MADPVQVELISDDDDEEEKEHNNNINLITPVSNHLKRHFSRLNPTTTTPTPFLILDDDPTPPPKHKRSSSSTSAPSVVPETPFSDLPNSNAPPIIRCGLKDNPPLSSGPQPNFSGVSGLICLESDDEAGGDVKERDEWDNITSTSYDEGKDLDKSAKFAIKDKHWENEGSHAIGIDEAAKGLGNQSWLKKGERFSELDVDCLDMSHNVVHSTCYLGNLNSTKTYSENHMEEDIIQISSFHYQDHGMDVRVDEDDIIFTQKGTSKSKVQKKQNKSENAASKEKLQEEKARLMAEKKLKKEQEKLQKAALKAEVAKSKQLEKDKQRWEKEAEKNIMAEIDAKVIELGSIGGPLITRFGEKGLRFSITSNPIGRSVVWRMTIPEEISQLSSIPTDIPYVLLIYDAEEFCKIAIDGSIMEHISSVQAKYPSYTICCLTNRLMAYINKREQDKYNNRKNASDWRRPPVEEVFAKLATHFANVHSRQCVDEAELADHVYGLTINLAKCRFRKKLTPLSVNANGGILPKDCVDRDLISKNLWLKALISIPKVQPRFAITIFKKYPTMKSLLRVYMDSSKSVHEKEFLLQDLTTESPLGNEDRRLGEVCSKRVYRILMAQNGSIKTDDVEAGADYFTAK